MNPAAIDNYPSTLFDDWMARLRWRGAWVIAAIGSFSILNYIGAAYLDGILARVGEGDFWRPILLQPMIAFYIIVTQYFLRPSRFAVTEAFRKMIRVPAREYRELLERLCPMTRRNEYIAIVIGAAVGIALPIEWGIPDKYRWLNLYVMLSTWIMFGLAGWAIYSSVAVTRLFHRLHFEPMEVDLFRPTFLDAIARRSLSVTLAYAAALALVTIFLPPQTFRNGLFIAIFFSGMFLFGGLLFLLSMLSTHRLLVATKKRELEIVCQHLSQDYRALKTRDAANDAAPLHQVNAWLAYEKRIQDAPEWALNTQTVRNLAASTLMPVGTVVARFFAERF